jgi:P27 family predicted phage terminase small subunit
MTGRPPLPHSIHLVRGTRDKAAERRRAAGQRPAIAARPSTIPPAPAGLRAPGRRAWTLYWQHGSAWLAETDRPRVERLCALLDDAARLRETIEAEGLVTPNRRTKRSHLHPMANSWLGILHAIERLEASLGFDPTSRQRLHADRDAGDDPTSRWLAGGKP